MAKVHARRSRVFINGIDASPYFKNADVNSSAESSDSSGFGQDWKTGLPSMRSGSIKLGGYLDTSVPGVTTELEDSLGSDVDPIVTLVREQGIINSYGWSMAAIETSLALSSAIADIAAASADLTANDVVDRVTTVAPLGGTLTPTANGGTTVAYNGGTATAAGAVGVLQMFSTSGNPVVLIEHSANGSTGWATLVTFAAMTSPGAQRVAVTGNVNPYKRATVTGGSAVCWVGVSQPLV